MVRSRSRTTLNRGKQDVHCRKMRIRRARRKVVHRCNPTWRTHASDRLLRSGLSGTRVQRCGTHAPSAVSVGPGNRPVAGTAASSRVRDLRRPYHASRATGTRHQAPGPMRGPSVLSLPAAAPSATYRPRELEAPDDSEAPSQPDAEPGSPARVDLGPVIRRASREFVRTRGPGSAGQNGSCLWPSTGAIAGTSA
jgi:hypothetical protein